MLPFLRVSFTFLSCFFHVTLIKACPRSHGFVLGFVIAGEDDEVQNDGGEATPKVVAVSVKLPTFYPSTPSFWFFQMESQFTVKGVHE